MTTGIILAGGLGSRLSPLTDIENKHLLPVYNRRMIELPIGSLVEAGVKDIILVTGGKHPGRFLEFLKNGHDFGINHLYYAYQEGNGGIVDALKLANPFIKHGESCVVILGDNYFEDSIKEYITDWKKNPIGAKTILTKVSDPKRFGIANLSEDKKKIVSIVEKPLAPESNLAVTGLFLFDYYVWDFCNQVTASHRNETEITDVLDIYNRLNLLGYHIYDGYWGDMGVFRTLMDVSDRRRDIDRGF